MSGTNRYRLLARPAVLILAVVAAIAPAQDLSFSTGEDTDIGGTVFADHEVLAHAASSTYVIDITGLTTMLPAGADIDAVDYIFPTNVYFSLDADTNVGGTVYADEDVILWNGAFSRAWDGSDNGLPPAANLDALDVSSEVPLVFSFSLDVTANLTGPGVVQDEDIVRWNGTAFDVALDFDGSVEGVPPRLDLDAIGRNSQSEWVMSFDAVATVDNVTFQDEDLATFDTGASAFTGLFFDGSSQNVAEAVDLNAAKVFSLVEQILRYLLFDVGNPAVLDLNSDTDVDAADLVTAVD